MRLLISPESRFGCVDSPPRRKGPCLPAGADSPTPLAASSSPLPGPCAFSESLCAPRSDASFGANRGGLSSGPLKAQVHVRSPEGPRARRRLHMRSGHAPGRGHPPPPSCSEQPLRSARVKSSQCSVRRPVTGPEVATLEFRPGLLTPRQALPSPSRTPATGTGMVPRRHAVQDWAPPPEERAQATPGGVSGDSLVTP